MKEQKHSVVFENSQGYRTISSLGRGAACECEKGHSCRVAYSSSGRSIVRDVSHVIRPVHVIRTSSEEILHETRFGLTAMGWEKRNVGSRRGGFENPVTKARCVYFFLMSLPYGLVFHAIGPCDTP
jgi:hypothetical protein